MSKFFPFSGFLIESLGFFESERESRSVCPILCYPTDCSLRNSPGQNSAVGSLSLLQEIFPTQGLNPGLPHYRQIFYQLSHKGSPRILEWPIPSPGDPPKPGIKWVRGIELGSRALSANFLPTELSGKPFILDIIPVSPRLLQQNTTDRMV